MKIIVLLIAISLTCQELEQRLVAQTGSPTKASAAVPNLQDRLLDRAKLIYGPDFVKTIALTNGKSVRASEEAIPNINGNKKTSDSPFDDPTDLETNKEMSYKGDAASGVILLEEKDALYLDVAPCHAKTVVFIFHFPFAKKKIGSLKCNDKNLDKYSVAQR